MGREFLFTKELGSPFDVISESMFLLPAGSQKIQRSARPKILILLDGTCQVSLKSGLGETFEPDDIFILPLACRHTYISVTPKDDARIYTFGIFFNEEILKSRHLADKDLRTLLRRILSEPRILKGAIDLELRRSISDFRREYDDALIGRLTRLRAIAMSLLVSLARKIEHTPDPTSVAPRSSGFLTNEVKEFLSKAKFSPLTLGQIAWHVKLSEEHLARIFKKETGMTVMDYLRYLRVDAAKTFLLNSNETIESLAKRLGFRSINPFCRAFKEATSQTPTEYRMNHAGSNLAAVDAHRK